MECGVHGQDGQLVVKLVVLVVLGRGNDSAIIRNQPTMEHTVWVMDLKHRNAMPQIPAQVRYIL